MHNYLLIITIIVFSFGCQPNLDKSVIIEEIRLNDRLFLGKRRQDSLSNIYEKDVKYWIVFNDTIRHFQLDDWTNIDYSADDGGALIFKDFTAASAEGLRVNLWELDGFSSKYLTEKDLQIKGIKESIEAEEAEKVRYAQDRNSRDFGIFLRSFLMTAYSGMNFDSLMYHGHPAMDDYISRDLGFSRFYNIGMHCESFGYELFNNQIGEIQPVINMLDFFPEREAEGGLCDEATTPDGVYYKRVNTLPRNWDHSTEDYYPIPEKYIPLDKYKVEIVFEKNRKKLFYFVWYDELWYFICVNDCDCST